MCGTLIKLKYCDFGNITQFKQDPNGRHIFLLYVVPVNVGTLASWLSIKKCAHFHEGGTMGIVDFGDTICLGLNE